MKRTACALIALLIFLSAAALAEDAAVSYSLTTGMPTDQTSQKLIAVLFDNDEAARPQAHMAEADVVYEAEISGDGRTAYTAIYNATVPETVEAVSEARILNVDIALDWGATLVHVSGQRLAGSSVYDYINTIGLLNSRYDGLTDSMYFHRNTARVAPHNAVCLLGNLALRLTDDAMAARSPFSFSASDFTQKGESVSIMRVRYDEAGNYYPSFQYNQDDGLYYRFYNRARQEDGSGLRYTCSNVIVMQADYTWYEADAQRPIVALTGTNACDYFIGGRHFTGTWARSEVGAATTYYDDEGNIVLFQPGKTFVQIIRAADQLEIVR
ncbi:MAG: DUF3048 domain-containing protein [Clostridia bacterium]|nr:DUF3048 domain-containing protein [Clostridia bacterium]